MLETTVYRTCPVCGVTEKEHPDAFGLTRRAKLCYSCFVAKQEAYCRSNEYKERQATYYHRWYSERGRRRRLDAMKATGEIQKAVKDGVLSRPTCCALCGCITRVVGHHPDYSKPLDVLWVCTPCHGKLHSGKLHNSV